MQARIDQIKKQAADFQANLDQKAANIQEQMKEVAALEQKVPEDFRDHFKKINLKLLELNNEVKAQIARAKEVLADVAKRDIATVEKLMEDAFGKEWNPAHQIPEFIHHYEPVYRAVARANQYRSHLEALCDQTISPVARRMRISLMNDLLELYAAQRAYLQNNPLLEVAFFQFKALHKMDMDPTAKTFNADVLAVQVASEREYLNNLSDNVDQAKSGVRESKQQDLSASKNKAKLDCIKLDTNEFVVRSKIRILKEKFAKFKKQASTLEQDSKADAAEQFRKIIGEFEPAVQKVEDAMPDTQKKLAQLKEKQAELGERVTQVVAAHKERQPQIKSRMTELAHQLAEMKPTWNDEKFQAAAAELAGKQQMISDVLAKLPIDGKQVRKDIDKLWKPIEALRKLQEQLKNLIEVEIGKLLHILREAGFDKSVCEANEDAELLQAVNSVMEAANKKRSEYQHVIDQLQIKLNQAIQMPDVLKMKLLEKEGKKPEVEALTKLHEMIFTKLSEWNAVALTDSAAHQLDDQESPEFKRKDPKSKKMPYLTRADKMTINYRGTKRDYLISKGITDLVSIFMKYGVVDSVTPLLDDKVREGILADLAKPGLVPTSQSRIIKEMGQHVYVMVSNISKTSKFEALRVFNLSMAEIVKQFPAPVPMRRVRAKPIASEQQQAPADGKAPAASSLTRTAR